MINFRPHVFWPALAAALLGTTVTLAIVTAYLATTDPSFAVESDYYEKAVNWDEHAAQLRENERLGWAVHASLSPLDGAGRRTLTVALDDGTGAPITDAEVVCEVFHRARSKDRYELVLTATDAPGRYQAVDKLERYGYWKVLLTAKSNGATFTSELVVSAPGDLG